MAAPRVSFALTRETSPDDRRRSLVALVARGSRAGSQLLSLALQPIAEAGEDVDEDLVELLRRRATVLEPALREELPCLLLAAAALLEASEQATVDVVVHGRGIGSATRKVEHPRRSRPPRTARESLAILDWQ